MAKYLLAERRRKQEAEAGTQGPGSRGDRGDDAVAPAEAGDRDVLQRGPLVDDGDGDDATSGAAAARRAVEVDAHGLVDPTEDI